MTEEIPSGSVIVTPADMWDTVKRIEASVNRVELSLTPVVDGLRNDHDDLETLVKAGHDDHETRIRVLERGMWKIVGIFSSIVVIATITEILYYSFHH